MSGLTPVQMGLAPSQAAATGMIPGISLINVYGYAAAVDATVNHQDVIDGGVGGIYAGFPLSAVETVTAVSTSAADAAAGTGLQVIELHGLDGNLNYQYETLTLNGLTPVTSGKTWFRVMKVIGIRAGSGTVNAGVITVAHSTTTADVFATLRIGTAKSAASVYTVPAGYVAVVTVYRGSLSNNTGSIQRCRLSLCSRPRNSGVWREHRSIWLNNTTLSTVNLSSGIPFPQGTDLVLRAEGGSATAANLDLTGSYDLTLFSVA